MPSRHRSATGAVLSRRENSIPHDAQLIDAGRGLGGLSHAFVPVQQRQSSFSWCTVCLVVYLVCASILGGIGLITVVHNHDGLRGRIKNRRLVEPSSFRGFSPQIKTLADMVRAAKAPEVLLEYSEVPLCQNVLEPADIERLPPKIKFLIIIGSQKSGTTWLYDVLTKHPSFISSMRRPGEDADLWQTLDPWTARLQSKELQFFNRWPLLTMEDYLHAWHSGVVGAMVSGAAGERILLDASPQYLMSAVAPPRIRAAVPHARFVLIVRDPPMRAMSDFIMMRRQYPGCISNPSRFCPHSNTTFLEAVQEELYSRSRRTECFFNSTASDHTTWHDCFACSYNYIELGKESVQESCNQHEQYLHGGNCSIPHFGLLDHGLYAAQLAWWLRFFAPEQFYIISAGQLRDPKQRIQILNEVKQHSGLLEAGEFTEELLAGVEGFEGRYNTSDFTADDRTALELLRNFYSWDQENLHKLVKTLYPESRFSVSLES